jgi:arylsulfatase A-like enzyme
MKTRREFLASAAGLTAAACSSNGPAVQTGARRPNVVYFFPDQMRAQAMGCLGNTDVKTPNIDKLAGQGVHFRNSLANTPVCCPARAILQTGQYASKNGMIANDLRFREELTTVAEVLGDEGYQTGFIGKWHLDGGKRMPGFIPPGPRRQGYQHWAANLCSHRHFDTHYFRDTDEPIPMEKFETEGWTDLGLEFIDNARKQDNPFFAMIQLGPPHNPYKAPPEYAEMYDPATLTLRPNWKEGPDTPGREDIAHYYGMVTGIDDQLGRVMKTLDDWGLSDDTIIVFNSDHGDMLGSQGVRLKRKPWEESIRVPGIFRYPAKVKPGREEDCLLSHVDMMPTLLSLCGATIPGGVQGTDLSQIVLDGSGERPDSAYFQIFGPFQGGGVEAGWRGVRTQRHMYARYADKPWVLYDLDEDPYQMNNLAGDPAAQSLVAEMDARIEGWMKRTGDSWDINWSHPVEDKGRLYRGPTFYTVDEYMDWAKENPEFDRNPAGTV